MAECTEAVIRLADAIDSDSSGHSVENHEVTLEAFDNTNRNGDEDNDNAISECSASSEVSETSTIEYDQEPFAPFKERVHQLVRELFPDQGCRAVELERLAEGPFNRVIGIDIGGPTTVIKQNILNKLRICISKCLGNYQAKKVPVEGRYILRIPRDQITSRLSYMLQPSPSLQIIIANLFLKCFVMI
jgi:hypothetical protein